MRRLNHDTTIKFRANGILAHALLKRAEDAGTSVSELLRSMVRERVGLN